MDFDVLDKIGSRSAFGVISTLLIMIQVIPLLQTTPAYGDPYWNEHGKVEPDHKIATKQLEHALSKQAERGIPLYRNHGTAKEGVAPQPRVLAKVIPSPEMSSGTTINGIGYDNVTPPDVQVAAGPLNIMEMVNLEGEIWAKDGTSQTGPFGLANFFGTGSDMISDPKVFFDSSSNRWFSSITDISTSSVKVAVSDSEDANGNFCVYTLKGPTYTILDQPIIGSSDDKIIVSVNDFSTFTQQFLYSQYWVMNKSDMLTCSHASFVSKTTSSYFSIHPVQSLTSTETEYMVSTSQTSSPSTIDVFSVNGVPPNPVTVSIVKLPISAISDPPSAVQPGTILRLDTGDARVQDATWSNGALWLAHTNACIPAGDTTTRSCLHLVEISTTNSGSSSPISVLQDFNYGVAGKYLFYPAIRELSNGDLFVAYGLSSSTDFPGIEVTKQAAGDKKGSIEAPTTLQPGNGSVTLLFGCISTTGCRYGDYFGAGLDPSDPTQVWVGGEYGSGTLDYSALGKTWATKIGSFTG
ncbi:MAG TPA: hypothetical protein VJ792_05420 [Candidatus Nitrosotalea sp.]|nr:hypothetical protein [Candidatus Nitrosotalea sp.]